MKSQPSSRKSPPKRRGAKKATTISVRSEKHISAICTRYKLQGLILTFRDVRDALNLKYGLSLSVGTIWNIAHGRYPKDNDTCRALGLPFTVAMPVCPIHGFVHEKRCPGAEPKPRRPTRSARRKRLIHDERWRGLFVRMASRKH